MAGINLKHIKKSFTVDSKKIDVLNDINLEIPENKITVLLGKSGCGKTTLLRLVGRLETADSGEIEFTKDFKTTFIFQEPRLMPWLNVLGNTKFGLKKAEYNKEEVFRLIEMVGLKDFIKAYPFQLSGGMQQRVAIARALAYKADFIMLDEPFAALDYFTREQMQKELISIEKTENKSLLFVTHSIDEAITLADKIAVIEKGRVKHEFDIDFEKENRNLMDEYFLNLKRQIMAQLDFN